MRLSSTLMTRCPCEPRCQAIHLPASPLPMMIASYCSGVPDMREPPEIDVKTTHVSGWMRERCNRVHRNTACQALTCNGTFPGTSAYGNFYLFETIPLVWP